MCCIRAEFIILLSTIILITSAKHCVDEKSCYDEHDVATILANPFIQRQDEETLYAKGTSKSIDTDETTLQETNSSCAKVDYCQLLFLERVQGMIAELAPKVITGKRGKPGPPGPPGPCQDPVVCKVGEPGLKGDQGPPGMEASPGFPGERGDTGLKGKTGQKGEKGLDGVPGITGIPGKRGRDGAMGEKGDVGLPGESTYGLPGFSGNPGEKGDKGDRGVPGALMMFIPSDQNFTEEQLKILGDYKVVEDVLDQIIIGNGEKKTPARSCSDLLPNIDFPRSNLIDPNGGDDSDAIWVLCDTELWATCIEPKVKDYKNITYLDHIQPIKAQSINETLWLSELNYGMEISYGASSNQIGFLHLLSYEARQQITFHCQNNVIYYDKSTNSFDKSVKLMTWNDAILNAGTNLRYLIISNDTCSESSPEWGTVTITYETYKPDRLPIIDIGILDYGENKSFGVDIGPVCFRHDINIESIES